MEVLIVVCLLVVAVVAYTKLKESKKKDSDVKKPSPFGSMGSSKENNRDDLDLR
jgi:hypothetical protein